MGKPNSTIMLFRSAVGALLAHKQLCFPLVVLAFVQFLFLELLYFAPRYPLSAFFAPIIRHLWDEKYLHYPLNLVLLPKLFYYSQIFVYLFLGSYCMAVMCRMIVAINEENKTDLKNAWKKTFFQYIHILSASLLTFTVFRFLSLGYGMVIKRAYQIQSTEGIFFWIKQTVILGAPYVQFIMSIVVTTMFIYVVPIIVAKNAKIFAALWENFKLLWHSFWVALPLVFLTSLFYVPVLILRNSVTFLSNWTLPEIQVVIIVLSILVTIAINACIMAAGTIYYLYRRENL